MGAKSSSRGGSAIRLIAIHTNEGNNPADVYPDRTAENLCRWMDDQPVSYHVIVDDDSFIEYVPEERASWSLRSGNPISLNLCFTGWSKWLSDEWMTHPTMLQLGAKKVREWCNKYKLPMVKLSSAEVGQNKKGVCGHVNWTEGKQDGNHTDPGSGFPWIYFMNLITGGQLQEDDMISEQQWNELMRQVGEIMARVRTLEYQYMGPDNKGWPSFRYNVVPGTPNSFTVTDFLRYVDQQMNTTFTLEGRPMGDTDKLVGHILSTRAELRRAAAKWDEFMKR